VYGEKVPVIISAVITGRAIMRPVGPIAFPARHRFTYIAGQAYRHYIETTFFGFPLLVANEYYVDGKGRMEVTLIGVDEGEKYNNLVCQIADRRKHEQYCRCCGAGD
jgi:hypothetical protein